MNLTTKKEDGHYWVRVESKYHSEDEWDVAQVDDGCAYICGMAHDDPSDPCDGDCLTDYGVVILQWGPKLEAPDA